MEKEQLCLSLSKDDPVKQIEMQFRHGMYNPPPIPVFHKYINVFNVDINFNDYDEYGSD